MAGQVLIPEGETPTWITHLLELRKKLLLWAKSYLLIFAALYPFNQQTYQYLAYPLLKQYSSGNGLIATHVIATFSAPLKLTLFLTLCLSIPILLIQFWRFLTPAMYRNERNTLVLFLIFGVTLFFGGVLFCYFWVLPNTVHFFQSLTPPGVKYMPDMSAYLDFSLSLLLAFGCCFEAPVVIVTLVALEMINIESLTNKRREVIVGCFIIGMILTPPDVISQIMLALPLWALYELSILISKTLARKK